MMDDQLDIHGYVIWLGETIDGEYKVCIDGDYTIEELEKILAWTKSKRGINEG